MTNRIPTAASFPLGRLGRGLYLSPEGEGGTAGDTDDKGGGGDSNDEVTFTPAQIAKIGEINSKERDKARTAGEKAARESLLKELGVGSLDDLKAKLTATPTKPKDDPKPGDDDAKLAEILAKRDGEWKPKLTAAEQRAEAAEKALADMKAQQVATAKRSVLVDAAAKAKAIDPAIVAQLCSDAVTLTDDGKFVVAGEGGPKLNAKGDPMSPEEYVAAFIAERPYLAASSGTTGSGTRPNAGNPGKTDIATQIAEAEKRGDRVAVIALKRRQAEQQAQ